MIPRLLFFLVICCISQVGAQSVRAVTGVVITPQFELVPGVSIDVQSDRSVPRVISDGAGKFVLSVPVGIAVLQFSGKNIQTVSRTLLPGGAVTDLQIKVNYIVPSVAASVTIQADALLPDIEYRNETIYENTLFTRDDQLIQTLNAGINAGQHEGGGKSLEIRRYGFNLDHGGVNGGLKILVDNIQQNQGTQGHGQGCLGSLKSLSPELVDGVTVLNGPFSASYGDFSGLGVVQNRLKESLPEILTARIQGGPYNTVRGFFAYSPNWKNITSFIAYEPSYTDGPFKSPLKYRRDNLTGNFTYKIDERQTAGFKFNLGRNTFFSSGQIPLDLVAGGELDRFGAIDTDSGGKVQSGTAAVYYRREAASGATFKADAYIGRSLFDLYSNFTFFAADPVYGDEIQQHDSRLEQGANVQYLQPYKFFGSLSLLTVGVNVHASQNNVGLYPTVGRNPNRKFLPGNLNNEDVVYTSANATVNNLAAYIQNGFTFDEGHVRLDVGLRLDYFSYDVNGFELRDSRVDLISKQSQAKLQPKLAIAWSPFERFPMSLYANYGRGISSQDARGVARNPSSPKLSTTDFYQAGTSYNSQRLSAVFSSFLIDRSAEQVYIPDDGSVELAGPSRSYGFELRTSAKLTEHLSFNGGLTRVLKSFYRGEFALDGSRLIVDSSPRLAANAGLVLSGLRGFTSSLTWRHISNYRLDGEVRSLRASGNDVVDLAVTKRLRPWVDLNFSVDNVLNKKYFETQNFFESRVCPTCDLNSRIHATPGYPFNASIGLTFRFFGKE